ncbi:MAG TPA: flagellar export chaperone FlgN [Egibacteraceae bacterium]|jgi:hypothetical protein|nr:flagellar export chaperone FlgN [Egibacteraceae bacterium]
MTVRDHTPGLDRLAETLGAERRVVEYLLYKLVAAKLLLAADEHRFVPPALEEVERVLAALREAEAQRVDALAATAREWAVAVGDLSLAELVRHAPEPVASVLRAHEHAFRNLAEEIEKTAADNRRLATSALTHVQRALDALTGPTVGATYTASGHHHAALPRPTRLDSVL